MQGVDKPGTHTSQICTTVEMGKLGKPLNENVTKPELCIEFALLEGYCRKAIVATEDGVYIVAYKAIHGMDGKSKKVVPVKETQVIHGRIEKVARIVDEKAVAPIIRLRLNGADFIGTPNEITRKLYAFGFNYGYQHAFVMWLLENAVETEEKPTTRGDNDDFIRSAFKQFIEEKKKIALEPVEDPIVPLATLIRCKFFIDTKRNLVVFKTRFLTEFGEMLMERYGYPKLTWRELARELGIKRTTINKKMYGMTLKNVFVFPYP